MYNSRHIAPTKEAIRLAAELDCVYQDLQDGRLTIVINGVPI